MSTVRGNPNPVRHASSSSTALRGEADEASSSSSPPALIDIDCNFLHMDMPSFPDVLLHPSTLRSNTVAYVSPGSDLDECEEMIRRIDNLSGSSGCAPPAPSIMTTAGVHPYSAGRVAASLPATRDRLLSLLSSPRVSCVGECGLDYSEGFPGREEQLPLFRMQVEVACEEQKPLFLHTRAAHEDTMATLKEAGGSLPPMVVHCFTGTKSELDDFLSLGCHIGFTGSIFKDLVAAAELVSAVPKDKLMIETDAPYMGFAGCRDLYIDLDPAAQSLPAGKRKKMKKQKYPNVPSSLLLVLEGVAKARGEEREEVAAYTTENAKRFFGL